MTRILRFLLLPASVESLLVVSAAAQLDLSHAQRADDGTVYEVIAVGAAPLASGVDYMRVTTVAGSVNGLAACSSGGAGANQTTSALSGANPVIPQNLHPYDSIIRSGVLTPDTLNAVGFNTTNGGRLTVGSGTSALSICRDPADCVGAQNVAPTFSLSQNAGGVPAACIASNVMGNCADDAALRTFAFGIPASGDPPLCSGLPTTMTRVCDSPPADGFTIGRGQLVVIIFNHSLARAGFTIAASGFGIDSDDGSLCDANAVITADGQALSAPPPIGPSPTATTSPLPTQSPTATATATVTPTPPPEICIDGLDNDGDGLVDCADAVDCPCETLIRDPAHICPVRDQLSRYTLHARAYPASEINTIERDGLTISLQYRDTLPWFRVHLPPAALRINSVAARGVKYRYVDRSPGPGIKKWSIRKIYKYGQLQYLINGLAMVPRPPIAGRYDIWQQVTIGDVPFFSSQSWQRNGRCLVLNDRALPN